MKQTNELKLSKLNKQPVPKLKKEDYLRYKNILFGKKKNNKQEQQQQPSKDKENIQEINLPRQINEPRFSMKEKSKDDQLDSLHSGEENNGAFAKEKVYDIYLSPGMNPDLSFSSKLTSENKENFKEPSKDYQQTKPFGPADYPPRLYIDSGNL